MILVDDSDGGVVLTRAGPVKETVGVAGEAAPLENQLTIFRVTHKQPYKMKRPLQSIDNVSNQDIAIRLYKVQEILEGGRLLKATEARDQDISVLHLLTSSSLQHATPQAIIANMQQWCLEQTVHFSMRGCLGCLSALCDIFCCAICLPFHAFCIA